MDSCFACTATPRSRGILCEKCAALLDVDAELCPEQIEARVKEPALGSQAALLIDAFGVGHVVIVEHASATVGRSPKCDVRIAERTVSVSHAVLEHRERSNAWFVADAQSENGTFVNGEEVARRFPLEPLDRVFFGRRVGFLFVPLDDDADVERAVLALRSVSPDAAMDTRTDVRFDDGRPLKVRAVTEGGAMAQWGDEKVQLSELEYELLCVLDERRRKELKLDESVRGFVPASHLLEALSFKSEAPTHANLRGLVRKVRGKLAEGDPSLDVIESRKGLGYRLARALDLQ